MADERGHDRPEGVVSKPSPRSVGATVSRLTDLLDDRGLRLFADIDQREAARQVGLTLRETRLVLFGSPKAGTPVMDAVPLAGLDLPLKILVWADGDQTVVSYVEPAAIASRYRLGPELAANLAGIDALTEALVTPGTASGGTDRGGRRALDQGGANG